MSKKVTITMWIFFSLMIAINAFVIFQACLPSTSSGKWSNAVVEVIKNITNGNVNSSTPMGGGGLTFGEFTRKAIGHFLLFGLDGIITYLFFYFLSIKKSFNNKWVHIIYALSVGIVVASLTEMIQLFVPGRAGDIIDVLLDLGGFVFFGGLTYLVVFLINHHSHLKAKENNLV